MHVVTIVSAPFEENSYVAHLDGRSDCLVFDPGLEPDQIAAYLDEKGLTPAALMITHGHADHIAGNAFMKERWPACPIVIGQGDAAKLIDAELNLSAPMGLPVTSPPADVTLAHGDTVLITAKVKVRSTATVGSRVTRPVTVSSVRDPAKQDTVRFVGRRS